jgi:hypothetical protein
MIRLCGSLTSHHTPLPEAKRPRNKFVKKIENLDMLPPIEEKEIIKKVKTIRINADIKKTRY